MVAYELFIVSLFGCFLASLASFFQVVIYRTQREESFASGRSRCEHCRRQIAWFDAIPLYSYVALHGRCRSCQKHIDPSHFSIEFLAFISAFSVYWWPTIDLLTSLQFLFFFILFFVIVADIRYLLVPDFFVLLLSMVAFAIITLSVSNWLAPLVSVGVALGFFIALYYLAKRSLHKEALGFGDIKLMVPIALLLPWPLIVVQLFLAFISGGIFATLILILGLKKFGQSLPFAPFLILSFVVTYFFGAEIWQWYTGWLF